MHNPPKLFLRFFRWFCHPDLLRPIEGDLLELYDERVEELGIKKANVMFRKDVLLLFRKDIIKPGGGTYRLNTYGMFKNYLKVAVRNLIRQKLYSTINIGGLSIGITCFLLIFLYIQHEYSYDKFFENSDSIYRVSNRQPGNTYIGSDKFAVTPAGLASALKNEYPEVISSTSLDHYRVLLKKENGTSYWEYGVFADRNFFDVFPYKFLEGNPKSALDNENNIVITKSFASKAFGEGSVLGQKIIHNDNTLIITGILEDLPATASVQFNFVASIASNMWYKDALEREKWQSNSYHTFFTVNQSSDIANLEKKMPQLIEKYWTDPEKYPQRYLFDRYSDIHLQTDLNFDIGSKGSVKQLVLFSVVAILILVLASINYTNLAIARSMRRAKEVGLRKVIGARRSQLTIQFLTESILISFVAFLISLALISSFLPFFGDLLGRPLTLSLSEHTFIVPYLFLLIIFLGLLAGSYPALYMSRLRPVVVLKGKVVEKVSGINLQKWLVVAQYTISIVMIICSLIIYQQFQFIKNKELGFDKENILTIRARSSELRENIELLKNEWNSNPNILSVSGSQNLPTNIEQSTVVNDNEGGDPSDDLPIYQLRADYDFLETYKIDLIAGRDFSRDFADTINSVLINETTLKAIGWSAEEAIGKEFTEDWNIKTRKIIGVVNDFHMHSMHLPIEPLFIELRGYRNNSRYISIKIRPENKKETIAYIEESIKEYSSYPFESMFIEDHFNQLYENDQKQAEVFGFFTILSVLIASLGLFGLAAFNINQRIKEVGIRKTLGASISNIVSLVSWDFIKMVLVGFLVSIPVAWYLVSLWFRDFAYHTTIEWWVFGLAGMFAILIAFITISSQSIRAAQSNPIECLRDE